MQRFPSLLTVALLSLVIPAGCSESETQSDVGSAVSSSTENRLHGKPAAFGFSETEDGLCDCDPPPPIVMGKSNTLEVFRAAQNAKSPPPRDALADQPLDSRPIDK